MVVYVMPLVRYVCINEPSSDMLRLMLDPLTIFLMALCTAVNLYSVVQLVNNCIKFMYAVMFSTSPRAKDKNDVCCSLPAMVLHV